MSEQLRLGESDADQRWVGIRRHQAVLVTVGLGLCGDWMVRHARAPLIELMVGVLVLVLAFGVAGRPTIAERLLVMARYAARSHWNEVTVLELGEDVSLWANGEVAFRVYELDHLGRLDLSGRDEVIAAGLAALVDAASAASTSQHLSCHVHHTDRIRTALALPVGTPAPEGWRSTAGLAHSVVGVRDGGASVTLFERFSYVRTPEGLVRVLRVRDFSAVPSSRPLLEGMLRSGEPVEVAIHVEVVSSLKSARLAARAAHRLDSDVAASRSFGFRRSARTQRLAERLAQREVLVASGRALLRVGAYVMVRAPNYAELSRRHDAFWRQAHDAGLRLERGPGLQARWFRAQLPGGVGW